MTNTSMQNPLTQLQKVILVLMAIAMATFLLLFRGSNFASKPLDELARNSISPEIALANQKPTIFEFYADWCEVCQKMAPSMASVEKLNANKLDIVLLNVDNEEWQDLLSTYRVHGIPQMNFFDSLGELRGTSIGFRSFEEIMEISDALIKNKDISNLQGVHKISETSNQLSFINDQSSNKIINPRSHS